MKKIIITLPALLFLAACSNKHPAFDASGSFEADEVIVSSELAGRILRFTVEEGQVLPKDSVVGLVDATGLSLQKEQVEASIRILGEKTADVAPQVQLLENQLSVQQTQLDNLLHEQVRIRNLVEKDAATAKQLDDISSQVEVARRTMQVTRQQIQVQKSQVATQNRGILSETDPLRKRADQLQDQLNRSRIVNPVAGTVLSKYAQAGEITAPGKALYKLADLRVMTLRAYVTGDQLPSIRPGQPVTVLVDDGKKGFREYKGTLSWIADKAEFTPKTIQTRDERANLVYAVKIRVPNDGTLKIGMYGEVRFR
jgi:HlyD family secretion protein